MTADAQFPEGRIPFRIRVGVTGHRGADRLGDETSLRRAIGEALGGILAGLRSNYTPVLLRAVSPLAEGADQLVAMEVLDRQGADLEVPLPGFPDGRPYIEHLETEASRREFERLRRRAVATHRLGKATTDDEAYERVGRWVVDHCDVLIAVWDGQRSNKQGGTAETVDYAGRLRVPTIIIDASTHERIEGWQGLEADCEAAFHQLDDFNRGTVRAARFGRASDDARRIFFQDVEELDARGYSRALADWFLAPYVRADQLAVRYQFLHELVTVGLVALAATAGALGAFRAIFEPEESFITWIEVVVLLGILFIIAAGKRLRIHDRWVGYRDLAERLRTAPFQAVLDARAERAIEAGDTTTAGAHVRVAGSWQVRAFVEVWDQRPRIHLTATDCDWMKRLLRKGWVKPQIDFAQSRATRHSSRRTLYRLAAFVVFSLTFVATAVHAFSHTGRVPEFVAIALPAVGAALAALANQREHGRHSQRYTSMERRLRELDRELDRADDLAEVRAAGRNAARFITSEKAEWQDLVKQEEVELPA